MKRFFYIFIVILFGQVMMAQDQIHTQEAIPAEFVLPFVQTKVVPMLAEEQVSTGVLTYKAPDYVCWEYRTPSAVRWEMSGSTGNVNRQMREMIGLILNSIQGKNMQTNADFTVTQEGNRYILIPKRKEMARMFSKIQMDMDNQTHIAQQVELWERDGGYTRIVFTK